MKKVLIDMDGVLADTLPLWLEYNQYNTGIKAELSDITHWAMHECPVYAGVGKAILRDPLDNPNFWADIPPMEGALDFLAALERKGVPYNIVTAPANAISTTGKYDWVKQHCPKALSKLVITNDKASIRGEVLIDDRDKNVVDFFHGNPEARMAIVPANSYQNLDLLKDLPVIITSRVPEWDTILFLLEQP